MGDAGGAAKLIERTFAINAAKVVSEPTTKAFEFRCARSQYENSCKCAAKDASVRRSNRPCPFGGAKRLSVQMLETDAKQAAIVDSISDARR